MFLLDPLPFSYDALEPFIDAQTMHLHHDKHHQTYVDKLNELTQETDLEKLIFSENQKIKNMAGGVYNHNLFWKFLTPGYKIPDFNHDEFTKASLGLFGSGWVWLSKDMEVFSTANQDAPSKEVILGIDLWEHAYYLQYQNRRKDYINSFFTLLRI
ncbi:MAG: superoxide dismutase [bacterium]|nr:superoxide dismutase [bacterium]